ncbi:NfeD family protein [Trichothermofontia sp.]
MSTLPNLLRWFFPRQQADTHRTSGLLAEPHNVFANYRQGRAIVASPILPEQGGRVCFKGSWWPARCPQAVTLHQGQSVRVIDVDRIALIVEPIAEAIPEPLIPSADAPPAFTLTSSTEAALDPDLGPRAKPWQVPVNTPAFSVGAVSQ